MSMGCKGLGRLASSNTAISDARKVDPTFHPDLCKRKIQVNFGVFMKRRNDLAEFSSSCFIRYRTLDGPGVREAEQCVSRPAARHFHR